MNLPTKLTVLRMILTPFFLVVFFIPLWFAGAPFASWLAAASGIGLLVIYVICELTDFFDGYIARKYHMVTDLGKVLDPFSDVLIRMTYFLCFASVGLMPVWAFAIILYREFGILFVRMLSMKKGIVLAANGWGKGKAVLYAVSAIAALLLVFVDRLFWSSRFSGGSVADAQGGLQIFTETWIIPSLQGLFILSAIVSLISFLTYLVPFLKAHKED